MGVRALATVCMGLMAWTSTPAVAAELDVPLEIGVGPATHTWFGPVGKDQPFHTGVVITADVVLDRAWFRDHGDAVPKRWRSLAGRVDEVRIRPLWYVPESLIVSPKFRNTGMVGASWRPVAVGFPILTSPIRVGVDVGARLTALYMWTDTLPDSADPKGTFFLRPGLDASLDAIFPLSDTIRVRLGVDGHAYVPQKIGGFGIGQGGDRMWAMARGFAELRVRFPVTVKR